ncbi:hypothetical protein [Skermanella aerolata]|uniref:hypothetical protein n=1 Tax=Skermanella aerolata TaxID=393310 RepID=UPI003D2212BE
MFEEIRRRYDSYQDFLSRGRLWLSRRLDRMDRTDRALWFLAASAVILWFMSFFQPDDRAAVSATAAAIPAALAAIVWTVRQHQETTRDQTRQRRDQEAQRRDEYRRAQSVFYLDSWRDGVQRAYDMLKDGNNSRVIWLTAARVLVRCDRIEVGITETHHRDILERSKDEWRLRFSEVLGFRNPKVTASFFYGMPAAMETDDAAIQSRGNSLDLVALVEPSVRIVWDFARFPEDYQELIRNIEFTAEEKGQMWMTLPDLAEWLQHIDRYMSDGKKLIPVKLPLRPTGYRFPEADIMIRERSNRVRFKIGPAAKGAPPEDRDGEASPQSVPDPE